MQELNNKLEQLITINGTYNSLESFLKDLKSLRKLEEKEDIDIYELYKSDIGAFIKTIFYYILHDECSFNNLLIDDRSFLKNFNDKVINLINYEILRCNDNLQESYLSWEDRSYEASDFSLDDLIIFCNFRENPSLPITKNIYDEEFASNKDQNIKQILMENSYNIINSCKKLCNDALQNNKGNFIIHSLTKDFYIHSFIIQEYIFFDNILKDNKREITLEYSEDIVKSLILFLYGENPFIIDNDIEKLLCLADYLCIETLMQICFIKLDNNDTKREFQIKKRIQSAKYYLKTMSNYINKDDDNLFISYIDEIILLLNNDDNEGIIKLINKICDDYVGDNKKELSWCITNKIEYIIGYI